MHSRYRQLVVVAVLIGVLCGLLVWAGMLQPNPAKNRFPGTTDVLADHSSYVGDRISVAGTVVDTEPLVIELSENGQTQMLTVLDSETDVETGQRLSVFGTLQSEDTIIAKDSYVRDPANAQYMYVVSFLAGLWVVARLLNGWQLNTTEWTVEPRETSLLSQFN